MNISNFFQVHFHIKDENKLYQHCTVDKVIFSIADNTWFIQLNWKSLFLDKVLVDDYFFVKAKSHFNLSFVYFWPWNILQPEQLVLCKKFLQDICEKIIVFEKLSHSQTHMAEIFNDISLTFDHSLSAFTVSFQNMVALHFLKLFLNQYQHYFIDLGFDEITFNFVLKQELAKKTIIDTQEQPSFPAHKDHKDNLTVPSAPTVIHHDPKKINLQQDSSSSSVAIKKSNQKKSSIIWKKWPSLQTRSLLWTDDHVTAISDLTDPKKEYLIAGKIFQVEYNEQWKYLIIYLADKTNAIQIKIKDDFNAPLEMKKNYYIKAWGYINVYRNELRFFPKVIKLEQQSYFTDLKDEIATKPRIEMHAHTKMSAMDGTASVEDYFAFAQQLKMPAIAFTDHNNLQAFPEIAKLSQKYPQVKPIYGVEMSLYHDQVNFCITPTQGYNLKTHRYVFFDLETTGLNSSYDEIIEFGAVILKGLFDPHPEKITIILKPQQPISNRITELTGITNAELTKRGQDQLGALTQIVKIIDGSILVAHNAWFDYGFLKTSLVRYHLQFPKTSLIIDTLPLSRVLLPSLKSHRLSRVCQNLKIQFSDTALHRATYDAYVLYLMYLKLFEMMTREYNIVVDHDLNTKLSFQDALKRQRPYPVTILIKNQAGLKSLYEVVSLAHTKFYLNKVWFPQKLLNDYRTNWLIGSASYQNDVFQTALSGDAEKLKKVMQFYDYIEVQPLSVYRHLISQNQLTEDRLKATLTHIIEQAQKLKILVIATSASRYIRREDKITRDVYIATKGLKGVAHPLYDYKNPQAENPDQHLRTTSEMLQSFVFLHDRALIHQIVVDNTYQLERHIEPINIMKNKLYYPSIPEAEIELETFCRQQLKIKYGSQIDPLVQDRFERELVAIKKNNYSVIYWIAYKLVAYSLANDYLVGSRGSVGSSFIAFLANITEVNPLPPHYLCSNPQCWYQTLDVSSEQYRCGFDLPQRSCPRCGSDLRGDGHNIPFATFLGINNNKIPDIDLNFADSFQEKAHNYIRAIFQNKGEVIRAGTISTVAQKSAENFIRKYLSTYFPEQVFSRAYINYLATKCQGVKRTTGQHPGGIIIIPKPYQITDFTAYNYPADTPSEHHWLTSHFDFHFLHDNLLKIDALGHMDPTALKLLKKMTHVDPQLIPMQDEKVLSIFHHCQALNVNDQYLQTNKLGIIGIPEFGTNFVRRMVKEVKPQSFADLVTISGLSHGTNVWTNNAQQLLASNTANITEVIGCRDDIMTLLHEKYKLDLLLAFNIMEKVRKGIALGATDIRAMQAKNVPHWYIASCAKIKYLFPKAHATAYVVMAWRIAWFKVYYPVEYYAVYFSTRIDHFDLKRALMSSQELVAIKKNILDRQTHFQKSYHHKNIDFTLKPTNEELKLVELYDVLIEMKARNIRIVNVDVNLSHHSYYLIHQTTEGETVILPPLMCIKYMGTETAQSIIAARNEKRFTSVEDFHKRTKITKLNLSTLIGLKVFETEDGKEKLPHSDNMTFF